MRYPYNPEEQTIAADAESKAVDQAFIAHFQVLAADAVVADVDGVHAAFATTTINIAATCVVEAATAVTDILTTNALPITIGASANALSINLTTAADDVLAVTAVGSVITIALADTTATKNTAALIQAAIRSLATVDSVDVSAFTCVAGGNWDSAAIATGETAAVDFTGGQDEAADVLTAAITNPGAPRSITATAGGTAADIGAIQVTVVGIDYNGEDITEDLPAFTVNTAGTVQGSKAFREVTSITIQAHDGVLATTSIGFGDKLGLPYKLAHNTVLDAYIDNAKEGTAPTVAVSSTSLESNTVDLNSALNGKVVDVYLLV
jgi:hypothetical protein